MPSPNLDLTEDHSVWPLFLRDVNADHHGTADIWGITAGARKTRLRRARDVEGYSVPGLTCGQVGLASKIKETM